MCVFQSIVSQRIPLPIRISTLRLNPLKDIILCNIQLIWTKAQGVVHLHIYNCVQPSLYLSFFCHQLRSHAAEVPNPTISQSSPISLSFSLYALYFQYVNMFSFSNTYRNYNYLDPDARWGTSTHTNIPTILRSRPRPADVPILQRFWSNPRSCYPFCAPRLRNGIHRWYYWRHRCFVR